MAKRSLVALAVALGLMAFAVPSASASTITLDNSGTTVFQQTLDHPCIIGDPSCNNPAGFGFTLIGQNDGWDTPLSSPVYTVLQIRNLLQSDTFLVGIDVNSTRKPVATEILQYFRMMINSGSGFTLQAEYTGPTSLNTNNNGNGYSDALLETFDLTGFADTDQVRFDANLTGATDGREEFFIIATGSQPCTENCTSIPEPATLVLFGTGLALTAVRLRRRKA